MYLINHTLNISNVVKTKRLAINYFLIHNACTDLKARKGKSWQIRPHAYKSLKITLYVTQIFRNQPFYLFILLIVSPLLSYFL